MENKTLYELYSPDNRYIKMYIRLTSEQHRIIQSFLNALNDCEEAEDIPELNISALDDGRAIYTIDWRRQPPPEIGGGFCSPVPTRSTAHELAPLSRTKALKH